MSKYPPEADSETPYSSNHSFDTYTPPGTVEPSGYVSKSMMTFTHKFVGDMDGAGLTLGTLDGVTVGNWLSLGAKLGAALGEGLTLGNALGW
jgi:hypothetical protein